MDENLYELQVKQQDSYQKNGKGGFMEKELKRDIIQMILVIFGLISIMLFLPYIVREINVSECQKNWYSGQGVKERVEVRIECYKAYK